MILKSLIQQTILVSELQSLVLQVSLVDQSAVPSVELEVIWSCQCLWIITLTIHNILNNWKSLVMSTNHGFIGVLTWKIKNLSKNLFKIQMSLLIWLVQERKLNIELILNLLTLKLLKKSQRLALKRVFTDSSTSQLQEPIRIHNHSIFKPKPSDNKLSEKLSQMQLFSDLVQFMD